MKPRAIAAGEAVLDRARAAYSSRAWRDACEGLAAADRQSPLAEEDLDRLAWSAALTGRIEVYFATLERLHDLRLAAGRSRPAARAAFWIGMRHLSLGEVGRATAWLGRAERLLANQGDCAEVGYLFLPRGFVALFQRNVPQEACEAAKQAALIADRHGDADLASLARMLHGQALAAQGDCESGLALLDEAMLSATRGEVAPMVTGIVYCSVIGCCQRLFAVDRAREWTEALDAWCRAQPQLEMFTGACHVHRSEIRQLHGAWREALEEARRAATTTAPEPEHVAAAHYQLAEIHRLRGEFDASEAAYRTASQLGRDPQPGLALLRLARGETDAAAAAIRQAVASSPNAMRRARHLPAAVEILLASGDRDGAERAAADLEAIAAGMRSEVLDALAAHARATVGLGGGEAGPALDPLRRAFATWQRVGAPYLAARVRTEIAVALDALGDREGAARERDAARAVFRELEASPDLARLDRSAASRDRQPFGLTARELEVLRLLASGRTNKAIAQELFLSEKTIDRHVSNIFTKLDVPTRAAATAFAYRHKLV
jgi:DNA-binding CsgD family transcriptional regulator